MPIKFKTEDMECVYKMVQEGTKIKDISVITGMNPDKVNQVYNAAKRRTWNHYQERMNKAKKKSDVPALFNEDPKPVVKRPPAVYSNRSPYGFA